jgi:transposase
VKHTQDVNRLRQALAVLLPAELNATLEQTAKLLGVGRATVVRCQRGFAQPPVVPPARKTWGGRRRALLDGEAEREFLRPWAEQAKDGGLLVLSPIRAALAQQLGRPVDRSVVWRMLARHGWRKIAPDTRHPKGDPQVQADWKKNCRKRWRIC